MIPTVEAQCWPILSGGHDLIGIAKSGSGKTLAFLDFQFRLDCWVLKVRELDNQCKCCLLLVACCWLLVAGCRCCCCCCCCCCGCCCCCCCCCCCFLLLASCFLLLAFCFVFLFLFLLSSLFLLFPPSLVACCRRRLLLAACCLLLLPLQPSNVTALFSSAVKASADKSHFAAMDCLPVRPPGPVTKQIPRLEEAIASLVELQQEGEVEAVTRFLHYCSINFSFGLLGMF